MADNTGEWVEIPAQYGTITGPFRAGIPAVDPTTLGADGPCVVKAINEDLFRQVLTEHWLEGIECDHERAMDNPRCACMEEHLGWHPSVGAAVQAWIDHVMHVASISLLVIGGTLDG